jgi:hypothetical protein
MNAIAPLAAGWSEVSNVVAFRPRLSQSDRELLARWVKAGRRMGLHDGQILHRTADGAHDPFGTAVIWVRENPDPAYLVRPEGLGWAVIDHLRETVLGRFPSFAAALDFIRPALSFVPTS